jgi:hypothetical protein
VTSDRGRSGTPRARRSSRTLVDVPARRPVLWACLCLRIAHTHSPGFSGTSVTSPPTSERAGLFSALLRPHEITTRAPACSLPCWDDGGLPPLSTAPPRCEPCGPSTRTNPPFWSRRSRSPCLFLPCPAAADAITAAADAITAPAASREGTNQPHAALCALSYVGGRITRGGGGGGRDPSKGTAATPTTRRPRTPCSDCGAPCAIHSAQAAAQNGRSRERS